MTEDDEAGSLHDRAMPPVTQISNPGRPLGKQAHRRIGANLRTMYQSIVQQPIPSRFSDLIAKLDDDLAVVPEHPSKRDPSKERSRQS